MLGSSRPCPAATAGHGRHRPAPAAGRRRARPATAIAVGVILVLAGCATPPSSGPTGATTTPSAPEPTAAATTYPPGWAEVDVTFATGAGTASGTLVRPTQSGASLPGALVIAGSGPTDRNGDQSGFVTGTLRAVSQMLARAGVVSLRYDKLGSGATGAGTVTDPATVTVDTFADQARAALRTLAGSPGVDPARLVVVGHSEGSLFAQILATQPASDGPRPARLALLMPLALRYLDLIATQIRAQIVAATALGRLGTEQAATIRAQLGAAVAATRAGTPAPELDPTLAPLFAPDNAAFLRTADALDPVALARATPAGVPVLVVCGTDDVQVDCADAAVLAGAVPSGAGRLVQVRGVSHVLKVDDSGNPGRYTAPLPYSGQVERSLRDALTWP